MREPCYKCKFENKPIDREPCEHCSDEYMKSGDHPAFQWAKSPTRADRIRRMTDEELAEFLYVKTCEDGYPQFGTMQEWLDWLKQESE